jgi:hypothetical protein
MDIFDFVVIESNPLSEYPEKGHIMVPIFRWITQVSNNGCHLIMATATLGNGICSHIKHDWKCNGTTIVFDMATDPDITTKMYEEKLWKRMD